MLNSNHMRKYLLILLLIFGGTNSISCSTEATSANRAERPIQESSIARDISAKEFHDKYVNHKGAILLDVRTPGEVQQGHLEGAINIDFYDANFQTDLNRLDKTKPIYIYCRSGRRSGIAMKSMKEMGFSEIYNLNGGIISWTQAGLPIAK